jgi:phage tail-like protein
LYHAAFIRPNRYPEVWLKFSVNLTRFDPHKNFKFRIKWDGRYVAGVSKISGLRRTTEVIQHREGGDPSTSRKSPGHTEFAPITLERGVTHDPEFENWANKVWSLGAGRGAEVSLKDFRKDVVLELYNEAGQLVLAYRSIAVGLRNTKSCPTWTPTRMRSLSSKSSWKTKAENEIDQ